MMSRACVAAAALRAVCSFNASMSSAVLFLRWRLVCVCVVAVAGAAL